MRGLGVDGRYRVVRNLCEFPNAETGSTDGWDSRSSDISVTSERAHSGALSYKVVTAGAGGVSQDQGITQQWTVPSSGRVGPESLSAWVLGPAGLALRFGIEEYTAAGSFVRTASLVRFTCTGAWQRVGGGASKQGAAVNILRSYVRTEEMLAETFYVDDVANFDADLILGYRDGDSPSWRWDDEPNSSSSRGWEFLP